MANCDVSIEYKIHANLCHLNINRLLKKIGKLFCNVRFCCGRKRVCYTQISCGGLRIPTGVSYSDNYDDDAFVFGLGPLIEYVRAYNQLYRLSKDRSSTDVVFLDAAKLFMAAYDNVSKFFLKNAEYLCPKYLCRVDVYGGLCPNGYRKLACLLNAIRHVLLDNGYATLLSNELYNLVGNEQITVEQSVNTALNRNSAVYNKMYVSQNPLYDVV